MAVLDDLAAQVQATLDTEDAAILLIQGFAARVQAAVDAAIAGGATAAQLAPVQDEVNALKAKTDALAAAVVAGGPAA